MSGDQDMTATRYWFTISQAADIAGISEDAVRTEIRENQLHPRRLGVMALIVDAELSRWLRVRFPTRWSTAHLGDQHRSPCHEGVGSPVPEDFSVDVWLHETGTRSTSRR